MTVLPAEKFGFGLEVICRVKAAGSFLRRYGEYIKEGSFLNYLVEFTLKNDEKADPFITKDTLTCLGILRGYEYDEFKILTKKITYIIKNDLHKKGLDLYDIKLEFGKSKGKIILIDEISTGCMKVFKDGQLLPPMELNKYIN